MSLNSTRLALPVGVVCFAAVALAQQPYNWVNNPPPLEVFTPAFDKVYAAKNENPTPFQSITGKFDPDHNGWFTTFPFPGAATTETWIGRQGTGWVYTLKMKVGAEERKKIYSNLVNAIQESKPGWEAHPSTIGQSVNFTEYKSGSGFWGKKKASPTDPPRPHTNPSLLSIDCSDVGGYVEMTLHVTPYALAFGNPPPLATVGGANSSIGSEIETVVGTGRYSALPTPQASQSGTPGRTTPGRTTLAITNGTQYSLRILASGPTEGQYTISPGATQQIEVSPGSYKIVGRVSASNVLPFYGTETYASGSKYAYRFFVK
jgi:hypothetical protein